MDNKFLIWLDILGFDNLAKNIGLNSQISARNVRKDFIEIINEKIKKKKRKSEIVGYKYSESDDWLLVVDSIELAFKTIEKIINHNTGYKKCEKIPLEIVIGTAEYDKWAKFDGSNLVIESSQ